MIGLILIESLLAQQRMGFAMAQVSGQANRSSLAIFMAVLELGAVRS